MSAGLLIVASSLWAAGAACAAGLDVADLETRVLSGEVTASAAIAEYCGGASTGMIQDAFCACPDDALRLLEERLNAHRLATGWSVCPTPQC
ncbi:hypothetical protein PZ897_03275 [Hoeflea sp. YIM 152468]|uniref:hypothetical protein n=1 Tax=Hoeflea sp. YIM 152468 TaxID=3031759 RepID=UPI0023DB122B|nr:hypothetical protein [Hoeflea sp. YIM 152468]MDF1607191.1 hypothetical protein [Hoeflea sp. YIM 152468]